MPQLRGISSWCLMRYKYDDYPSLISSLLRSLNRLFPL